MKRTSDVTALIVSNGLDVSLAAKLAESYKRVLFHVPRDDEFPRVNDAMIGVGMGDIEVIDDMWGSAFDDADLFVFPDLGFPGLQLRLESLGKPVWGARNGEEMEQDRAAMKQHLAALGLPVGKWEQVRGFTALRELLQQRKDVFVKVSRYRGSWESLYSADYELVKPELDERELALSGVSETIEFIVEERIDGAIEMATDGWCIDGAFPSGTLVGVEQKDAAYVGRFMAAEDVPPLLSQLNRALTTTLCNYGYRGFWSPEALLRGSDAYLNDPCTRIPSPPGELYLEFYTNLADIIWAGAHGEIVEPVPIAPIGVQLILSSEWSDTHWNTLTWPSRFDRNIKLREACRVGGRYHTIPQHIGLTTPGSIIGWGASLDEAEAMVRAAAETLRATQVKVPLDALDELRETLAEAAAYGLKI